MTDDGNRSYSEEEFALILRKASELQAKGPGPGSPKTGMALRDIKQIAAEVGIEPEFVERAAALARNSGTGGGFTLVGGPMNTFHSDEIQGQLTEGDMARLIDVVRDTLGSQGTVTEVLDSVEWKGSQGELRPVHVTLSPRDGVTKIQVRADQTGSAVLSFVLPGLATVISTIAIGASLEPGLLGGFGVVAAGGLTGFTLGRTIFKHFSDRFQSRVALLTERLRESGDALVSASAPAQDADAPHADPPPEITSES